jgi:hypothetical protein
MTESRRTAKKKSLSRGERSMRAEMQAWELRDEENVVVQSSLIAKMLLAGPIDRELLNSACGEQVSCDLSSGSQHKVQQTTANGGTTTRW